MQPASSSSAQQLRHGGDLVGLGGHFDLAEHQRVARGPGADDDAGRVAAVKGAAQRLAVHGDALLAERRAQRLRPSHEHFEEGLGFERGKHAVERVVPGDARAQAQERAEPCAFGPAEILHVVEALAATQQAAQGDHEHVHQLMFAPPADARVGQLLKLFDQTEPGRLLHPVSCTHCIYKVHTILHKLF